MNARDIFVQAIQIELPRERRAFVEDECAGDSELKWRVEALLQAHDEPESFLERPAFDIAQTERDHGLDTPLSDGSSRRGRFLPGAEIADRYRVNSLVGRGGMGEVYLAEDLRLDQMVALKFLPSAWAKDEKRLEYFFNEVRLARQISHRNVCRVYDIAKYADQFFISMEYIDGEDLKTLLSRIGSLPTAKALEIAHQLCAGLGAAHACGVLHRDIKPANVMIDGRGQARLMDFGLAIQSQTDGPSYGMSGTPAYMAPEQLLDGSTSVQSDIYSLGSVLFEVMSGRPLLRESTLEGLRRYHRESTPSQKLEELGDQVDPLVANTLMRCLSPEPTGRPASTTEVSLALPGGDPLAAAVTSGDTPSPRMIAASGGEGLLPIRQAWGLVAAFAAISMICLSLISGTSVIDSLDERVLDPAVLQHRAGNMLKDLGVADADNTASGFVDRTAILNSIRQQVSSQQWDEASELSSRPFYGLEFWFRARNGDLLVNTSDPIINSSWNRVSSTNPTWDERDLAGIRLSPDGHLRWFRAERSGTPDADDTAQDERWHEWFTAEMTGFDIQSLETASWQSRPDIAADHYVSWEGVWPGTDLTLRAHAASLGGRPVFFEVLPSVPASPMIPFLDQPMSRYMFMLVDMLTFALALINYRRGRGDRRAARRLALYVCTVAIIANLILASHVFGHDEMYLLIMIFVNSCGVAAYTWVLYMAVESFARRHWPEVMISWTQIFHGANISPRVGVDLIAGAIGGASIALVEILSHRLFGHFTPVQAALVDGPMPALGEMLGQHVERCILFGYGGLALLVVIVMVVRSKRLATIAFVPISICPMMTGWSPEAFALTGLVVVAICILLWRGFFSLLVCLTVHALFLCIPTVHPTHLGFSATVIALVISFGIVFAGLYISQGRHRSVVRQLRRMSPV
mgnify:FL=1